MKKLTEITFTDNFKILCKFSDGESRVFDLQSSLDDRFSVKIVEDIDLFKNAKIGEFGQIYWSGLAEIIDFDGKTQPCDYDISPEFIYYNSKPL